MVHFFHQCAVINDVTVRVRILHEDAEVVVRQLAAAIQDGDFYALVAGAGEEDVNGLRVYALIDKEDVRFCLALPVRQRHRFSGGGRFIQQ